MAKTQCNFPASLDTLNTDRQAGQTVTSDSYDVIETAITEIEKVLGSTVVYPQAFATGTGTSGDPWAGDCINDAYTACPTGGTIYLRAGYYSLTTRLDIAKSINLIGEGIQRTFIITDNNAWFYTLETDYVTFKGFTMDGDGVCTGALVNFNDCQYIVLEDLEVLGGLDIGILNFECNYGIFKNLFVHNNNKGFHPTSYTVGLGDYNSYINIYCYDNTTWGFDAGEQVIVKYNTFYNINAWGNDEGIGIVNNYGMVLSNSTGIENTDRGIYLNNCDDSTINNCITNLNGTYGTQISLSDNVNLTNVIAKNNNGWAGIIVNSCNNVELIACQSYDDRVVVGDDIAFVDSDPDTITQVAAGFVAANIKAGQDIIVTGAGEAGNNDTFTVASVVAGTITLDGGDTLTAEAAGQTVTITQYLQNYGLELSGTNTAVNIVNCKLSPSPSAKVTGTTAGILTSLEGVLDGTKTAAGDIQYHDGTNWIRLAKGTSGQVLTMSTGDAPEWATP